MLVRLNDDGRERDRPIASPFGAICEQHAGTNKGGLNAEIDDGCAARELTANDAALCDVYRKILAEGEVSVAYPISKEPLRRNLRRWRRGSCLLRRYAGARRAGCLGRGVLALGHQQEREREPG
jgi:hypothetical protein